MYYFFKRSGKYIVFFIVSLVLLLGTTATFAWLSTTWTSGNFTLKGEKLYVPTAEVWTYHKQDEDTDGWYITYQDSEDNILEKVIPSIGTFTSSAYTPNGDFSLYLGTINNLAQEDDNLPVYLKFELEFTKKSANTVTLDYTLDSDYLKVYKVDLSTEKRTGNIDQTLSQTLSNNTTYPFLHLYYAFSDDDYSITDGDEDIPKGLDAIFNGDSATATKFTGTLEEKINNPNEATKKKYLYLKFSVSTDTIQSALQKTDLKTKMPAYLVFDTKLALDIKAVSSSAE